MNLVLTFDISLKANSNASTHTNYLITLLKNDLKLVNLGSNRGFSDFRKTSVRPQIHFFDLTANYTGEPGRLNSLHLPVCLDYWGLAEGHRALSERGIIATRLARSTK